MSSTNDDPDHSMCPNSSNSWCRCNWAIAKKENVPTHKNRLPGDVRAALEPVFARLSDEDLLQQCSNGKTQNTSECLHFVIWSQASKNCYVSLLSVSILDQRRKWQQVWAVVPPAALCGATLGKTVKGSKSPATSSRRVSQTRSFPNGTGQTLFLTPYILFFFTCRQSFKCDFPSFCYLLSFTQPFGILK